jgi:hypothetical protein
VVQEDSYKIYFVNFGHSYKFLEFKIIEKTFKSPGTVLGRNRPDATAHGARQPATRGRQKSRLGHGLAARPSGENGLRGPLQRARRARDGVVTTRRLRAGRRGGTLTDGKVLLKISREPQGGCRTRKRGQGCTGTVGRRRGGANGVGRRCSTAAGSLRWSSMRVAGSCSSRETRG